MITLPTGICRDRRKSRRILSARVSRVVRAPTTFDGPFARIPKRLCRVVCGRVHVFAIKLTPGENGSKFFRRSLFLSGADGFGLTPTRRIFRKNRPAVLDTANRTTAVGRGRTRLPSRSRMVRSFGRVVYNNDDNVWAPRTDRSPPPSRPI